MLLNSAGDKSPIDAMYASVSPGSQRDTTCEPQIEQCKQHIKKLGRDPATFVVITDEGSSSSDRPGFAKVLELLRAGRLRTLVVTSLDRLGRRDCIMNLLRDVVHAGGEVIAVEESIPTNRPGWADLVRMASMDAETWGSMLSARVRIGQRRRAAAAMPLGPAAAGYTVVAGDDGRKRVAIDPPAAAVVRGMFERVAKAKPDEHAVGDAARWVNSLKADVRKSINGGRPVSAAWVRRTLTNAKYAGDWTWGRTVVTRSADGRKSRRPADPKDLVVVRRPELAIVTDALFARVQAVLARGSKRAA